jgi:hypothetical protein
MEAVAYVAGEPWSDHPCCTCPVITAFMVAWNDGLPNDDDRTRLLLPLIPALVGTRGSPALETRRANMAADWYIRAQTPAWLRLAGLTTQAETLETFPEITDFTKVPALKPTLDAIRKDADAAWAGTEDAARSAAWSAAEYVARSAEWSPTEYAAWSAAYSAAWFGTESALAPTVAALQESAVDLVKRMCAETDQ